MSKTQWAALVACYAENCWSRGLTPGINTGKKNLIVRNAVGWEIVQPGQAISNLPRVKS